MGISRRKYLAATGGAILTAAALSGPAEAADSKIPDVVYGHGMVWNRDLPGVAGEVNLSFDLRVNPEIGTGFGTAEDPLHSDWNVHFAISSVDIVKIQSGENRLDMRGLITNASDQARIHQPIRILAETSGDSTAIAIRLGDLVFMGAGIVSIEYLFVATILALSVLAAHH